MCQYYNKLALDDCVKGRTDRKSAAPIRKPDIRMSGLTLYATRSRSDMLLSSVVWYTDSRHRGYLSPRVQGDAEGLKAEIEARRAKRREMRASQPEVEYPVFKLSDMLKVPKHAQAP